jgi:hypothetical protein
VLISADHHVFPIWAPEWLRAQVEAPNCSCGTHQQLRKLAKWLVIYFAEHEGEADRWLHHAAQRCARDVPNGEVARLLAWAEALFAQRHGVGGSYDSLTCDEGEDENGTSVMRKASPHSFITPPNLEEILSIAKAGPRLVEFRDSSPLRLSLHKRNTTHVLEQWARYAQEDDPWVCFGRDARFWTRRLSTCQRILPCHQLIVPSPMRAQVARTVEGKLSEHSLEGVGERTFLVAEFDFSRLKPSGEPTIWAPLLDECENIGITILDLNAALIARLGQERPLWMTVFSGNKSLQAWFPCRGEPEEELHHWFNTGAERLGACHSTLCKSQFVRMPDGTRASNNARQRIEFFNPEVL